MKHWGQFAGVALVCAALAGMSAPSVAGAATTTRTGPSVTAPAPTTDGSTLAPSSIDRLIDNVPQATLDTIGLGTQLSAKVLKEQDYRVDRSPKAALRDNGLPEIVVGTLAWCPHCALGNVALAVALSHFGTFSHLSQINTGDYFKSIPDINGLSFERSSYRSPLLGFSDTIVQTVNGADFERPTFGQYLATSVGRAYPLMNIGGVYGFAGVPFNPAVAKGMSLTQVVTSLSNPSSKVAQAIDGYSNLLTAAICSTTGDVPGLVCGSTAVLKARRGL